MLQSQIQAAVLHFFRYGLVGAIVYGVDFGCYSLITWFWSEGYQVANVIGRLGGAAFGFFAHKYFTFRDVQQAHKGHFQLVQYVVLLVANIAVSALLLWLLYEYLALMPVLLARLATDITVILASFLVSKYVIFRS